MGLRNLVTVPLSGPSERHSLTHTVRRSVSCEPDRWSPHLDAVRVTEPTGPPSRPGCPQSPSGAKLHTKVPSSRARMQNVRRDVSAHAFEREMTDVPRQVEPRRDVGSLGAKEFA